MLTKMRRYAVAWVLLALLVDDAAAAQGTTDYSCARTTVGAFDDDPSTPDSEAIMIPTQASTCWSFAFTMTLTDVFQSANGTILRLDANYQGTLVLAEPTRSCSQGWSLTSAMNEYGASFLDDAHMILDKPRLTFPLNRSSICYDTNCPDPLVCSATTTCPTRCDSCYANLYQWALIRTELTQIQSTAPPMCCDETDCYARDSYFQTDIQPDYSADGPATGTPSTNTPTSKPRQKVKFPLGAAIGVAIGGAALLALPIAAYIVYRHCKHSPSKPAIIDTASQMELGDASGMDAAGTQQDPSARSPGTIKCPHISLSAPMSFVRHLSKPASAAYDVSPSSPGSICSGSGITGCLRTPQAVTIEDSTSPTSGQLPAQEGREVASDPCYEAKANLRIKGVATPNTQSHNVNSEGATSRGVIEHSIQQPNESDSRSLAHTYGVPDSLLIPWSSISMGGVIGSGGFGRVYKGQWEGNRVAVKMLGVDSIEPVVRDALYREAIIMAELRHPCIARVYGLVDEAPYHALVMQYYRRGTLAKFLSSIAYNEMSPAARLRLALQVATGMRFLHERKPVSILHGDLKTSNLLLEDDGRVVIADFGLASSMKSGMQGDQTALGGALTISISPPEVLLDPLAPRTAAGDVYAFGIVLYEVMTGWSAYRGLTGAEVRQAVIQGMRPTLLPYLPPTVAEIIMKCWAHLPLDRPAFSEVANLIAQALHAAELEAQNSNNATVLSP